MQALSKPKQKYMGTILDRDGSFVPSKLLKIAKNLKNIMHSEFEWDNLKAGHEYRLAQARRVIRRYNVLVEKPGDKVVHIPVISGKGESEYKPLSVVVRTQSEYERALNEAYSKFAAAEDAVRLLRSAAVDAGVDEDLVKIALISEALMTAREGLKTLH